MHVYVSFISMIASVFIWFLICFFCLHLYDHLCLHCARCVCVCTSACILHSFYSSFLPVGMCDAIAFQSTNCIWICIKITVQVIHFGSDGNNPVSF
jgi:hypothetical protein